MGLAPAGALRATTPGARAAPRSRGATPPSPTPPGDAPIVLVQADPEAVPAARARASGSSRGSAARPELDLLLPVSNEPLARGGAAGARLRLLDARRSLAEAVAAILRVGGPAADRRRAARRPSSRCGDRRSTELPAGRCRSIDVPAEAARRGRRGRRSIRARTCTATAPWTPRRATTSPSACRPARARFSTSGARAGATAAALRARGVGSDRAASSPTPEDAAAAARVYDEVVSRAGSRRCREDFRGRFDAVLFGDVLEHLDGPARRPRPRAALARPSGVARRVRAERRPLGDRGRPAARPLRLRAVLDPLGHARPLLHAPDARRPLRGLGLPRRARSTASRLPPSPLGAERLRAPARVPGSAPDLDVVGVLRRRRRSSTG